MACEVALEMVVGIQAKSNMAFQTEKSVCAWHIGISGTPLPKLRYRLRASWQESLGTYDEPYFNPKHNVSLSAETKYDISHWFNGLSVGAAFGIDRGTLLGNSTGARLSLHYMLK